MEKGAHIVLEKRPLSKPFFGGYISLTLEGANLRLLYFFRGKIEGWTSLPFNPRFLKGGFVSDSEGLGRVIDTLLTSWNLRGKILSSFPGHGTLLRIFSLPVIKGANLEVIIPREARRQFSFSPDTHFLFWQAIPGRATTQVYALIVPKEPLLNLIASFEIARRKLHRLELKPLILLHLLGERDGIITNIEPNSIEITIAQKGLPSLLRSIFLGDELLPQDAVIERAIEEVGNTITYYNETHRESPLELSVPIYLSGSLSESPRLKEELASFTGHPLAILEPPFPYPPELPLAQFLVNIGLIVGARKK